MSDLNRAIAKELGWTVKQLPDQAWQLYMPDGYPCGEPAVSEVFAWQRGHDYEHSIDAVVEALPNGSEFRLLKQADKIAGSVILCEGFVFQELGEDAPAKALLEYLKWKSQQPIAVQSEV